MHDIPFDLLLGLASLVYVFTNFVSNVTAKQWSSVEKQVLAWVVGVGALMLAAHSNFAPRYTVAGLPLDSLNWVSLVFLGLLPPSFGGVIYHLGQRFDNNGTGTVPDLPSPPPGDVSASLSVFPNHAVHDTEAQIIHLQPEVHVHMPEAAKPARPAARRSTRDRKTPSKTPS